MADEKQQLDWDKIKKFSKQVSNDIGAAMLGATVSASREAAAQTKATQKAVGYQDTPHGAQRCDNCLQFEPPSSCKTVDGKIAPAGWCKIYVKKPA